MSATSVIAIDGPAGSGKSSVSKAIARRYGLAYLDTGAMYRALTWWALQAGIDPQDSEAIAGRFPEAELVIVPDPDDPRVVVDGVDVSLAIRESDVTAAVSAVSAVPEIRAFLVGLQRGIVSGERDNGRGCVVEGRDIASVVLPDADVKVFLTADTEVRARRRAAEDEGRTGATVDVTATAASLESRDEKDSGRAVSPLTRVDDAVHIDATHLTLQEVIGLVADLVDASEARIGEDGSHV